ncbi:MAG: MraY family glycosyltransferase [Planctomycetota bacterium]
MTAATGAWFIAKYGYHLHLLDEPIYRSSHLTVKPKAGGIGILVGFIIAAIMVELPAGFWVPAALLSILSFMSDRFRISVLFRFLFQFGTCLIFLNTIWQGHPFSSSGLLLFILLSIFIVATTNYYNFMDGINGMAGISGIVGFGLLAVYAISVDAPSNLIILNICMALCCLGFLPFNFPGARVFMGDVGSILLGFVFSAMVVWLSVSIIEFICLASFLFPFYADEITTEFVRLKDGERLWTPHRRHLYQILTNEYGVEHWKISLWYGLGQLIVGLSVLVFMDKGISIALSLLLFCFVMFIIISGLLRKKSVLKTV